MSRNPILNPVLSVAGVEKELKALPHLTEDLRHSVKNTRHRLRDAQKLATAAKSIDRLPAANEALHLVISGRFALWHVVPAAADLAACRIDELRIATLGFSRDNVEALCGMIDAGRIRRAWLLCSHYFKGTSKGIYEFAQAEFERRADQASFLSLRTHAKLLLLKFADGRTLTVESSANLRSCKNIEQMTLHGQPQALPFSRGMD